MLIFIKQISYLKCYLHRVTVEDLLAWENKYGEIPRHVVVIMNSGWSEKYPDKTHVWRRAKENEYYRHVDVLHIPTESPGHCFDMHDCKFRALIYCYLLSSNCKEIIFLLSRLAFRKKLARFIHIQRLHSTIALNYAEYQSS